jgi:hypothetical protein
VPLAVATGVTAMSVAAVTVLGGASGTGGTGEAASARPAARAPLAASPTASPSRGTPSGTTEPGAGSAPGTRTTISPEKIPFTVTATKTAAISATTTAKILSSCLGADAARYHAVLALRAPVASEESDGVVLAVDSAGQYVQCATKGSRGSSQNHPPTFINDRLWGTGRLVSYFDSVQEPVGSRQYLALGAGHYTSEVARMTVSLGDRAEEYPVRMAGGAFAYAVAFRPDTPPGPRYTGPSPYLHAYDAAGKEIYDQAEDPKFAPEED